MNDSKIIKLCPWPYLAIGSLVIIIISIGWWVCFPCWFYAPTTMLLVRHADRNNSLDELKVPEGTDRAEKLVHVAGLVGIQAIYHTNTVRTRDTAEVLAGHLNITPTELDASETIELVNRLRNDHHGQRVLVVGHSNTVPDIIEELGGPSISDIPHDVYDNLYVITLLPGRAPPQVLNLKYGAPTPP